MRLIPRLNPCCYCAGYYAVVQHIYTDHCPVCGVIKCSNQRCRFEVEHLHASFKSYLARTQP